jgi:hypothetical protein
LCGDRKEEHIDIIYKLSIRHVWSNGGDGRRENMVHKIDRITMVKVEVLNNIFLTSPHVNIVLGVSKV